MFEFVERRAWIIPTRLGLAWWRRVSGRIRGVSSDNGFLRSERACDVKPDEAATSKSKNEGTSPRAQAASGACSYGTETWIVDALGVLLTQDLSEDETLRACARYCQIGRKRKAVELFRETCQARKVPSRSQTSYSDVSGYICAESTTIAQSDSSYRGKLRAKSVSEEHRTRTRRSIAH